jgi:hypothetical protein
MVRLTLVRTTDKYRIEHDYNFDQALFNIFNFIGSKLMKAGDEIS